MGTLRSKKRYRAAATPNVKSRQQRTRFWLVGGGMLAVAVMVLLFGNRWVASLANQQARYELSAQHRDDAVKWLRWSLKWYSRSPETELMLSRTYRKLGKFADSHEHLERARALGLPDERCERELILMQAQRGVIPANEMDTQLALLLSDPGEDAAEISEAFANGYLVNQRYTEAMRLLDAWHLDYPDDAQPHYMRGITWHYLGSLDAAEKEYRRALELQPTHYPAAMALGNFLIRRRRVEEALPYFEMCAGATNEGALARVRAAHCLRLLGMPDEARRRIEEVLAEDPDMLAAGIELAQLDVDAGKYGRAISWLQRGAAEDPRDTEVRYALATALAASGQPEKARQHFDFVAEARPAVSRARELIISLNDDPDNTAARTEIGRLLLEYGSEREGVFWLRSALSVDPSYEPALETLNNYDKQLAEQHPATDKAADRHRLRTQSVE